MEKAMRLEDIIKELPEDLRKEVEDFALFLLERRKTSLEERKKLKLSWIGALKDYREIYSSVELQKKSLEWMIKNV
ncbi:DUF2281 domain-containing protein, partial [Fervidobacterium sp.]